MARWLASGTQPAPFSCPGTGRILLPLARAGVTVCGMDRSLAMLDQLCKRLHLNSPTVRDRVTIMHGDIRYDDAGGRFPLIIAAGNMLHSFIERQDQPGSPMCADTSHLAGRSAGTAAASVFKTTDGAASWQPTGVN
jgi:hypothetical protein